MDPITFTVAVIVAIVTGWGCFKLSGRHYYRRWRNANELVATLQEELQEAQDALSALPAPPAPAPIWHQAAPGIRVKGTPTPPWRVTVRTLQGVTTVYAKRGNEMKELETGIKVASPSYDDDLAQALTRARRRINTL